MAKKPFKETKVGKFLSGEGAGNLLNTIGQVATGNWIGAVDSITDMIQGSTELTSEKKELALQYLAQDLEAMKLEVEDRKDARAMQSVALGQDDIFSKRFVYYFITFWSLFSATFILATTFGTIPESNIRLVDTTQGFILGTAISSMFAYLLGSTLSSKGKDSTIARLTK